MSQYEIASRERHEMELIGRIVFGAVVMLNMSIVFQSEVIDAVQKMKWTASEVKCKHSQIMHNITRMLFRVYHKNIWHMSMIFWVKPLGWLM